MSATKVTKMPAIRARRYNKIYAWVLEASQLTAELGKEANYQTAFTETVSASAKTSRITNTNTKTYRMDLFKTA